MPDSTRYREYDFIGGRILEAREMSAIQNISAGRDSGGNVLVRDLNALYREGATLNIKTVVTAGTTTVTLAAVDSSRPMEIFIRGRWEPITGADIPTLNLATTPWTMFLNWNLTIVDSTQDASLIDPGTAEPTANVGQLVISISATDTSGTSLPGTQLTKNTSPIPLFVFAASGSTLQLVPADNANPEALGSNVHAGLVKISTSTGQGVALANDDPRAADARNPLNGSVVDASCRVPSATGGTNTDGSQTYDLTLDAGGISAAKIIWVDFKERLSDVLSGMKASVASITTAFANHVGSALGQSFTHPMPTAYQVGAAPLSHITLPLGVIGSHPATTTTDSGGYRMNRVSSGGGTPGDPAYGVFDGAGAPLARMEHSGNIWAMLPSLQIANPGGPHSVSGSLGDMNSIAAVLAEHVNQNSHGNPHGLTISDLLAFTPVQQGTGIGQLANAVKIGWSGNSLKATVDSTDLGSFIFSSSFPGSTTGNGWQQLNNGLIIQWMTGNQDNTTATVFQSGTWPVAFPNVCFMAQAGTIYASTAISDEVQYQPVSYDRFGWQVRRARGGNYAQPMITTPTMFALGF
jgi:hypothetical protein